MHRDPGGRVLVARRRTDRSQGQQAPTRSDPACTVALLPRRSPRGFVDNFGFRRAEQGPCRPWRHPPISRIFAASTAPL